MKTKIYKKLLFAGLLLSACAITKSATERNSDDGAGVGNGDEIGIEESRTAEKIDDDTPSAIPLTTQELIDTGNLIEAARTGNLEAANAIIHGKSSSLSIAFLSHIGIKPYLEDLELLINQSDNKENTPLIVAAKNGHTEIVQTLLNVIRYHDLIAPDANIYHYITPENNIIAARFAAENGHTEIVQMLRAHRIFISDYTNPLKGAILSNNLARVQASCKRCNPNAVDQGSIEPLILATTHGYVEIVQALLAADACPDIIGPDGDTALHAAAFQGHTAIVNILLADGACPHIPKPNGDTALHTAASRGHTEIVHALLNAGIPINLTNRNNDTPLNLAFRHHHTETIRALIKAGSTIHEPGESVCWAARYGYTDIVHALLNAGAYPDTADQRGFTALQYAAAQRHTEIAQLLIKTYRENVIRQCPEVKIIKTKAPTSLLEQTFPVEIGQLIASSLDLKSLANFRSASTNCLGYANHEFEKRGKLRADQLQKKLIGFITSAYFTEYNDRGITSLLNQEMRNAQKLDLFAPQYELTSLNSSYSEDSDIAGPAPQRAQLAQEQAGDPIPMEVEYKSECESDTPLVIDPIPPLM